MTEDEILSMEDRELVKYAIGVFGEDELIRILKTTPKTFNGWMYKKLAKNIRTTLEILLTYKKRIKECEDDLQSIVKAHQLLNQSK